jgi:hypothetical protein
MTHARGVKGSCRPGRQAGTDSSCTNLLLRPSQKRAPEIGELQLTAHDTSLTWGTTGLRTDYMDVYLDDWKLK